VVGAKNSAESLKILTENISKGFSVKIKQRMPNSSNFHRSLLIESFFIRLSVGKVAKIA